jgi:hypothetical protein
MQCGRKIRRSRRRRLWANTGRGRAREEVAVRGNRRVRTCGRRRGLRARAEVRRGICESPPSFEVLGGVDLGYLVIRNGYSHQRGGREYYHQRLDFRFPRRDCIGKVVRYLAASSSFDKRNELTTDQPAEDLMAREHTVYQRLEAEPSYMTLLSQYTRLRVPLAPTYAR